MLTDRPRAVRERLRFDLGAGGAAFCNHDAMRCYASLRNPAFTHRSPAIVEDDSLAIWPSATLTPARHDNCAGAVALVSGGTCIGTTGRGKARWAMRWKPGLDASPSPAKAASPRGGTNQCPRPDPPFIGQSRPPSLGSRGGESVAALAATHGWLMLCVSQRLHRLVPKVKEPSRLTLTPFAGHVGCVSHQRGVAVCVVSQTRRD